jgi:hypothetical protein
MQKRQRRFAFLKYMAKSLKKFRLYYFFKYFVFRASAKHFFFKKFSKQLYYSLKKKEAPAQDNFLNSAGLTNISLDLPFSYFLIWAFHRPERLRLKKPKIYKAYSKINFKTLFKYHKEMRYFLDFRRSKRWRFLKMQRAIKKGFHIDWDFLLNFLIDKFFFKYNVDTKYFLIFVLFFKDLQFKSVFNRQIGLFTYIPAEERFLASFAKNFLEYQKDPFSEKIIEDFQYVNCLHFLVPFGAIKVNHLLMTNDHVTAIFLAKYFAIKLYTGHTFRDMLNPVVKELKRIVFSTIQPHHKMFFVDRNKTLNFLTYRSSLFKFIIFKNFSLYKILFIKFFKDNHSFFNFYILWFFIFFFFELADNYFFLVSLSKSFFFKKQAYNLFFNYDFRAFSRKIFNFFLLVFLNFSKNKKIYFRAIFDEIFLNFNVIFNEVSYFSIDVANVKAANFFYNQALIFNH